MVLAFYLASPLASLTIAAAPPAIAQRPWSGLLDLLRKAPAAAAGSLGYGLLSTTGPALYPAYAVANGMTMADAALGLAAIQLGGLALQLPMVALADRLGRLRTMATALAATAVVSLALLLAPVGLGGLAALLLAISFWSGLPGATYAIAAAHANEHATDADRITWSSSLLLFWGIGAIVGPLVASLAMDRFGSPALFAYTAVTSALIAAFLVRHDRCQAPTHRAIPGDDDRHGA